MTYSVPLIGVTRRRIERAREFFGRLHQSRRVKLRIVHSGTAKARQRAQSYQDVARFVSRGRPIGKTEGTWVTDCAELGQCILLCSVCDHKFRPAHLNYGYFRDNRWENGVGGNCDGCRVFQDAHLQLYVHESYIGQSYRPR